MDKRLIAATAGILLIVAGRACAQPALQRVEERLRRDAQNRQADGIKTPPEPKPAQPGYLGVVVDDRQEQGRGVRLMEVVAGGPAAKGGLKKGDLVTAIDGQPIRRMSDVGHIVERLPPGRKLAFQVARDSTDRTIEVTLGQRPPAGERPYSKFGLLPDESPQPKAENPPQPSDSAAGPLLGPSLDDSATEDESDEAGATPPPATDATQARILTLERRIRELEKRVSALESQAKPQLKPLAAPTP